MNRTMYYIFSKYGKDVKDDKFLNIIKILNFGNFE